MLPPYFSAFSASPGLRPPKERRHAPGVMDTPFPLFITFKSGRAATSFIPASFSRRISGYPPIPPRIFLLRTDAHPLNPPTRDRRPCPSIRTTSDRKYRFDLLFASLLCTIVVNIFFPEDIYDGIAQTIYLPIQLIAGISLFDIRRKGYLLTLLLFLGGLLIVGRLLDSFTPLNLREYLVFAYVVFFGWVTLELFRQIYTAPLVDRESVLAALCGLLLIGYCGFFVFVAVEFHQPGSFSGLTPGGQGFRDLFYFSYVTILTIGYGDITPHTWVAKNATILVALIAYMYSLVIVAMIVNQFAENRTLKRQEKARLSGSAQARLRESPPSGEGD